MSLFAPPEIENYWRYELKYRISRQQYQQVKNALSPYVHLDYFTGASPAHRYFVRSLYFDSLDYQSYNEKLGGNYSRYKFRIRTYSECMENDPVIRVEAKLRQGDRTEKYGALVSAGAYLHFMKHYHWDCGPNPVLIEFERNVHARVLRPKVLVEYFREGYRARAGEDVRITFDHNVRSAQTKMLFPPHAFFRQHYPHQVILEIKSSSRPPDWLKAIVQNHSLKIEPNSKYCQGIEVTQLDQVNYVLKV